jgi:hypothetical protein
MKHKMYVETHKSSHKYEMSSKFPPLIPDRPSAGDGIHEMDSVHELGSKGKSLVLEDAGTLYAKKAVKLRSRIAALDEQMRKVKRGITRERHHRSNYGGAAASKQNKRREQALLNNLEASLMMWTVRDCDTATKNNHIREKINQKRIEMTALKRIFHERVKDLNETKENIKKIISDANDVEKKRMKCKEKLDNLLKYHKNQNNAIDEQMDNASYYIEESNSRAMERIDQVLKRGRKKEMEIENKLKKEQEEHMKNRNNGPRKKGQKKTTDTSTFITGGENDDKDEDEDEDGIRLSGWKPNTNTTHNQTKYIEVHSEEEYRLAFETIGTKMGGVTDPQELVNIFLLNESELFEHFRTCESIHDNISKEKNEMKLIKNKYQKMKNIAAKENEATKEKLEMLQAKIDRTKEKDKIQKRTLRKIKDSFDKISNRMSEMFTVLGCDEMDDPNTSSMLNKRSSNTKTNNKGRSSKKHDSSATMRQYLGEKVNEVNIIKYLGVIESKMLTVVNQYTELLASEGIDITEFGQHLIGPSRPHGNIPEMMTIEAPKMMIHHLVHNRSSNISKNEDNVQSSGVMKNHDPVSPLSRDAIKKELIEQAEIKKNGGIAKRRSGFGGFKKIQMGMNLAKEANKVIEYL